MRLRRGLITLLGGTVLLAATATLTATTGLAATAGQTALAACSGVPAWAEGVTWTAGSRATYTGRLYQALQTHTPPPSAGWTPPATPALWSDLGACDSTPSPTPTRTTPSPTPSPTTSPTSTPSPTPTTSSPPPGTDSCALKPRPAGKVLQGYWESWDGAANGVHPGLGWIPITDSRIRTHGYNVVTAAFPVIRADGTVLWENGMDAGVKVPTPAEMCQAKAAGLTVLLSIGGATAGIDLSSTAVADRFVATVVPILKRYNFDGIDIDIETGLTGSGNINQLSTSQANLVRIIDGVLAQMPAGFGLTMAPETAYVTGGSVTYGSIWGAYLPIIKRYVDNGRLWWLNMQYYNGSMYGCSGDSYAAGTVPGFVAQTNCLNTGLVVQGTTIRVPYDRQVPGLPAQSGAGGGYLAPSLVAQAWNTYQGGLKGLMTWSINWDGSKGWTFGDNVKALQGR
ncbi:glycosyl hydrolase family 18 protein [Micromonospora sp. DR5-3]|uniref:glycosyl hydrolase family 18 protein n=1 Tax=unclassified Micromonospora TaxID=2617518 RepID=UPI0011DB4B3E|nr:MULTISPECIES: glycosyl hydrolase family 18 protein [unclassified Micromonospora]MCW3819925.1 glycosyl hydrolase family 18 protein [Micromonospora sp. DR5-3]TYC20082.1 glycoside hydrolase family 18 [Micromonospora sp. MP36]